MANAFPTIPGGLNSAASGWFNQPAQQTFPNPAPTTVNQNNANFSGAPTVPGGLTPTFNIQNDPSMWMRSTSGSTGGGSSSSQSGINWNDPASAGILRNLLGAANKVPGVADSLSGTLQAQYESLMRDAMQPQNFQGVLNNLNSKGMLNSTVAGTAMGRHASDMKKAIGDKMWDSQLAGSAAQMQVPSILAEIARLGQQSTGSGSQYSSGSGYSQDPYEADRILRDLILGS